MSKQHPIIAVTGSSGAGTSSVSLAFAQIFRDLEITAAMVSGDSFHLHTRSEFNRLVQLAPEPGQPQVSHFGPSGNDFTLLEQLFDQYGKNGTGRHRKYIHSAQESEYYRNQYRVSVAPGEFTPYQNIEPQTDLLFYEGLHGMVKDSDYDVARHVDFAVGVVPVINLEWIQKMYRDRFDRGHDAVDIVETILRRMPDYVHHVVPQFSRTHVNFQRVALVDTSNPFVATEIPGLEESLIVIHFRAKQLFDIDLAQIQQNIPDAYETQANTMVIPGREMGRSIELICGPIVRTLVEERSRAAVNGA